MPDHQAKPPLQLFYSYSHKDEEFRNELEVHLWGLKRQGLILGWHDRKIGAGADWSQEISRNLESSHIILLLISANFIASEYCYEKEMRRAMEKHDAGESRVIPVIIRNVDNWQAAPFGRLQAVPKDAKPVSKWPDRDEAWVDVTRSIRLACNELHEIMLIQSVSPSLVEKSFRPEHDSIALSGKTIELINPSDETLAPLNRINSVTADISYGQVAGVHGNRLPAYPQGTKRNIDEVLEVMNRAGREQGETVEELRAGDVSISRVDLLVKKSILLQAEAEEIQLDKSLPEEERMAAHRERIKESYDLLREANKLDPVNTEVLLYMAQLLMVLTPEDAGDEERILNRIRKLLNEPKDEKEEFRLARATYLLSVTKRPPDTALLREARNVFTRLGQTKWVKQCDELLKTSGALDAEAKGNMTDINVLWQTVKKWGDVFSQPKAGANAAPPAKPTPQQPSAPPVQQPEREAVQRPQPAPPQQQAAHPMPAPQTHTQPAQPPVPSVAPARFIPFGQWQIQVNDVFRSVVYLNLIPNGVCFGSQFIRGAGHVQFRGRWNYNPQTNLFQLQGFINGVQSFMLNIIIHSVRGSAFYGVGSDGYAYLLSPCKPQ
ncbi:MAG TPA: TIR domain-containing protein [Pyrinomonadaceae bacterium]|nr:TIR domain-containing protein [Pyrinomonadaceae bacterium]